MTSLRILAALTVLTVFPGIAWMPSPAYAQAAAPPAVAGKDGFVVNRQTATSFCRSGCSFMPTAASRSTIRATRS